MTAGRAPVGAGAEPALCAIAVMAKAPRPGAAKTRLVPPLAAEEAAALSAAFLRDVTENLAIASARAPIGGYVAYAPAGSAALFDGLLAPGTRLLLADGSPAMPPRVTGFGRSLLHAAQGLFALGHGAACLLNSDSPTLPTRLLLEAAEALARPGDRVVLGPAEDGGYYLIGLKAPHAHLFEDVRWSSAHVAAETVARAAALGLELVRLASWYDVDDRAALGRLLGELARQGADSEAAHVPYAAPATAACLSRLALGERLRRAAAAEDRRVSLGSMAP